MDGPDCAPWQEGALIFVGGYDLLSASKLAWREHQRLAPSKYRNKSCNQQP
jgi:hypothetical protein